MPKKLNKTELCVEEEVKIAINIALERFRISEDLLGIFFSIFSKEFLKFHSSLFVHDKIYTHLIFYKTYA